MTTPSGDSRANSSARPAGDPGPAEPLQGSCCFSGLGTPSVHADEIVPHAAFDLAPWPTIRFMLFNPVCNGQLTMQMAATTLSALIEGNLKDLSFEMLGKVEQRFRAKPVVEDGYNKTAAIALFMIAEMRDSMHRYHGGDQTKIVRAIHHAPAIYSNQFLFGVALQNRPEDLGFLKHRDAWQVRAQDTLPETMKRVVLALLKREQCGPEALIALLDQHSSRWGEVAGERPAFKINRPPLKAGPYYRNALGSALKAAALEILQIPLVSGDLFED